MAAVRPSIGMTIRSVSRYRQMPKATRKSDETYAESAGSDCKEILLITFNTYFKLNSPFRGAVLRKSMSLIFLLGTSNLT